jgi:hypothetical protein
MMPPVGYRQLRASAEKSDLPRDRVEARVSSDRLEWRVLKSEPEFDRVIAVAAEFA